MSITGDKLNTNPITITNIPEGESTYTINVSYLTPEEDRVIPRTLNTSFKIHFTREKTPEPDPITPTNITSGAFPEGLSSDYFTILAHDNYDENDDNERDSFFKDSDIIDKLNTYASNYLQNRTLYSNAESSSLKDTDKFYAQDNNGIYILIDKEELNKKTAANLINTKNNPIVEMNGKQCYKVYIKGTCELAAITTSTEALRTMPNQKGDNTSSDGDKSLNIPNGYYLRFGDGTENNLYSYYMFIVNKMGLLKWSDELKTVNYDVKKDTSVNPGYYNSNNIGNEISSHYNQIEPGKNYLFVGENIDLSTDMREPTTSDTDRQLFYEASQPIIKTVIAADNITEINNFWHNPNAATMIINVENIGDYAFYNSNISADILTSPKLKRIGKYAFAGTSNLSLSNSAEHDKYKYGNISYFPLSSTVEYIGDYAFKQSSGLNGIDLSGMSDASPTSGADITIGTNIFENCSNLRYVKYAQYQVSDICLPPDRGSNGNYAPRTAGVRDLVTTNYLYDYTAETADPQAKDEAATSKYTFLFCNNITFDCVS